MAIKVYKATFTGVEAFVDVTVAMDDANYAAFHGVVVSAGGPVGVIYPAANKTAINLRVQPTALFTGEVELTLVPRNP